MSFQILSGQLVVGLINGSFYALLSLGFAVYRTRVNRLERAHRTQEEFSHKLLQSQELERQRIASELHDSLGQSLLIIKNRVALAQRGIETRQETLAAPSGASRP